MVDTSHIMMYVYGFFALLGLAGIIGLLKTIDWIIGQKYVTHHKCEKCRAEMYKTIAMDHDLLKELNAKMDIMLKTMGIQK